MASPPVGFDENDYFHHGTFDAVRGNLTAPSGRGSPFHSLERAMDAENTYQVSDWLWSSGQLSERDIASLPSLGIEAVINLALPTSSNALSGEAELVTRQGINYFHIPVVWEAPGIEQLMTFFDILASHRNRRVWVHCAKNMRVSAFIYLYRRLRLLESEETAAYPMKEIWVPNEIWQSFINHALRAP